MATVIQRGRRGIWTAVWYEVDNTSPTGMRQRWKSTKLTNRKKAQEAADLWESAALAGRVSDSFRMRTAEIQRSLVGASRKVTVRDYLTKWMERTALDVKPVTLKWYKSKEAVLVRWLESKALQTVDVARIQRSHLEEFLNGLRVTVSAKTTNDMRKFLQDVFKDATSEGIVVEDPAKDLAPFRAVVKTALDREKERDGELKLVQEERRPFTIEEMRRILSVADKEWQSLIMFGLHSAQRLKDVATMTWKQVDLIAGELVFGETSKTGRHVRPAIGRPFMTWLLEQEMPDDLDAPIHPNAMDVVKRTGETATLSKQFTRILINARLRPPHAKDTKDAPKVLKGRNARRNAFELSYHCLRHTHTTWLKQAGASEAVAMDNVGHDSTASSQTYTHVDLGTRKKYADLLPEI